MMQLMLQFRYIAFLVLCLLPSLCSSAQPAGQLRGPGKRILHQAGDPGDPVSAVSSIGSPQDNRSIPFSLPRGPNDSAIENSRGKPLKVATEGKWGWLWGEEEMPSVPKVSGGIGSLVTSAPVQTPDASASPATSGPAVKGAQQAAPAAGAAGEDTSLQIAAVTAAASIATQTIATDSPALDTKGLACEASGLCSLGHVKPFKGDIWPSAGLKASIAARSYKKELILVGETRLVPIYQFYDNLRKLGFGHILLLTQKAEKCDKNSEVGHACSCWKGKNYMNHMHHRFLAYEAKAFLLPVHAMMGWHCSNIHDQR